MVRVQGTERVATTDSAGSFLLPNLDPGRFTILFEATNFTSAVRAAEVRAGEETELWVSLDDSASQRRPHRANLHWNGMIGCAIVAQSAATRDDYCRETGLTTEDETFHRFEFGQGVTGFAYQVRWDPSQPEADGRLRVEFFSEDPDTHEPGNQDSGWINRCSQSGFPGFAADCNFPPDPKVGRYGWDDNVLFLRVRATDSQGNLSAPLEGVATLASVYHEQRYEVWATLFVWGEPIPSDYQAGQDVPQA